MEEGGEGKREAGTGAGERVEEVDKELGGEWQRKGQKKGGAKEWGRAMREGEGKEGEVKRKGEKEERRRKRRVRGVGG